MNHQQHHREETRQEQKNQQIAGSKAATASRAKGATNQPDRQSSESSNSKS